MRLMRTPAAREVVRSGTVFIAYSIVTVVTMWPAVRRVSSRILGDGLDPWQTLWGMWWWRVSYALDSTPMHSRMLWWPDGSNLWFQTWDIPSVVAVWPLWGVLPEPAIYNLPLLLSFPLSGLTCYWLCRAQWHHKLAAALAGALYTFSTYHFAHAQGTLHIASMQWSPLYFLGLALVLRGDGRGAILAGIGLSLATMASPYHLVFALIGTPVLILGAWAAAGRPPRATLWHLLLAAFVFALCTGWLVVGMLRTYLSEPFFGSREPLAFSADLQSLLLPNPASIWASYFEASRQWRATRWQGAVGYWAGTAYVGYCVIALAWWGTRRYRMASVFAAMAAVGAVLALGPQLQVGGRLLPVTLPYAWMESLVPILKFGGAPSRFSWLATFGGAVAAGAGLAALCERGRRGCIAAVLVTALALVESWPCALPTSSYPRIPVMETWAQGGGDWAVLDATGWSRCLWHQMQHRRPIVGGYVTRVSAASRGRVLDDPVLMMFVAHLFRLPQPSPPPDAAAMQRRLVELRIRFVVLTADREHSVAECISGLRPTYRDHDVVVFEVPGM
jgi:hypothetical protein